MPKSEIRTCKNCGTDFEFHIYPSQKGRTVGLFCSHQCHSEYRRKPRDIGICKTCGKEFEYRSATAHTGQFCSLECAYRSHVVDRFPVKCPNCGKINYWRKKLIDTGRRCCNAQCLREHLATLKRLGQYHSVISKDELLTEMHRLAKELGHTPKAKEMDEIGIYSHHTYWKAFGCWHNVVAETGLPSVLPKKRVSGFTHSPSARENHSRATRQRWQDPEFREKVSASQRGEKHWNWKGGISFSYGDNWNEQRRKAYKRDKYTCRRCGKIMVRSGEKASAHHIIPLRLFHGLWRIGNALPNLLTLCSSCHKFVEDNPILLLKCFRVTRWLAKRLNL